MAENDELKSLLMFMATRSEIDALAILARLRESRDPISVLNFVRHGDLILQQHFPGGPFGDDDGKLRSLDQDALNASPKKVPARPWTTLVGDGLVSELVSSFAAYDYPFYFSFVDMECFLSDMRSQKPRETRYCSPLLVNAICSLRSVYIPSRPLEWP